MPNLGQCPRCEAYESHRPTQDSCANDSDCEVGGHKADIWLQRYPTRTFRSHLKPNSNGPIVAIPRTARRYEGLRAKGGIHFCVHRNPLIRLKSRLCMRREIDRVSEVGSEKGLKRRQSRTARHKKQLNSLRRTDLLQTRQNAQFDVRSAQTVRRSSGRPVLLIKPRPIATLHNNECESPGSLWRHSS